MHFAPRIRTVGVIWRQIKAADRSNPEPSPFAVPPTTHSPFLSMCGKGWMRPSSDSYAHTQNYCHQSERERWWASECCNKKLYSRIIPADLFFNELFYLFISASLFFFFMFIHSHTGHLVQSHTPFCLPRFRSPAREARGVGIVLIMH